MSSSCRTYDWNHRKAEGMFRFRIICGAVLLLVGINWLLHVAGITVMEPLIRTIFPVVLIAFGVLLLTRAFSRRRDHGQA